MLVEILFFMVENLRFSSNGLYFCLFFPFSSLDVCKYASRSKTKNSAPNLLAHTVSAIAVTFLKQFDKSKFEEIKNRHSGAPLCL